MARRSIRIAKGVRLNFNKSGASVTFSHKGLLGGTHSNTVRLTGGSSSSGRSAGAKLQGQYGFKINDDGTAFFYDANGNRIYDESLIRKMKATDQFREQKTRILEQRKIEKEQNFLEEQNAKFKEIKDETESVITIHTQSPKVFSQEECLKRLSEIRPREYKKEVFSGLAPLMDNSLLLLRHEAEETVKAPFWKRKKAIEQYIEDNIDEFHSKNIAEYEEKKRLFEEEEEKRAALMNEKYIEEAEYRKNEIRQHMDSSEKNVENAVATWLESVTLTVNFGVEFEYKCNERTMILNLDLPSIDEIPKEKAVKLSSGEVKAKAKTQKELKQDYILCVFSLALFITTNIFNTSTAIQKIIVSGFSEHRDDKTGSIIKDCVFSVICPRKEFETTHISLRDPQQFCLSLENRCNITASLIMKPVEPFM